jgi:hypothetical protein
VATNSNIDTSPKRDDEGGERGGRRERGDDD